MDVNVAKKIATDLEYLKKKEQHLSLINTNLLNENKQLSILSEQYVQKIELLTSDSKILMERGNQLESEFKKCSTNLQEAKEDKPSRMTWFGAGVISTLIVIVLGAIALN